MRITIAGQTYHVGFRLVVRCSIRPENAQRWHHYDGESQCHPPDVFNERTGKLLAFRRAFVQMQAEAGIGQPKPGSVGEVILTKEGRAGVWKQVLAKLTVETPDPHAHPLADMLHEAKVLQRRVGRQMRELLGLDKPQAQVENQRQPLDLRLPPAVLVKTDVCYECEQGIPHPPHGVCAVCGMDHEPPACTLPEQENDEADADPVLDDPRRDPDPGPDF